MGRNFIAERTWADPKERAAQKALKAQRERQAKAADTQALAAYRERSKWCAVKGCDKPAANGWMGCCSEQCMNAWLKEVERRSEVKEARKLGIPVAVYRQQLRIRGEI